MRGLVQRFSSSGAGAVAVGTVPVTTVQFPPRRTDGSQSPPLSAEGRARRRLEEQQQSGAWDA